MTIYYYFYYSNISIFTSMSSATEVLLNIADKANIKTANITVVSLNPLEEGLFIVLFLLSQVIIFLALATTEQNLND